jgi:Flp pilus assembly protein TadG
MQLKARRGAVVVILGIMVVALVSITAISIDFSRLWALRNELQTAADAAAHAGAIQLLPPNNAGNTISVATSYAQLNKTMTQTASVDAVVLGDWDDAARTFTPGAPTTDGFDHGASRCGRSADASARHRLG